MHFTGRSLLPEIGLRGSKMHKKIGERGEKTFGPLLSIYYTFVANFLFVMEDM